VSSVRLREPEFTPDQVTVLLEARRVANIPRGPHGIPWGEATDPGFNPYDPKARGRFEAKPIVDFAQAAIDKAIKERRRAVSEENDWPLIWQARRVDYSASDGGEG